MMEKKLTHINKGFLSKKALYVETRNQWRRWLHNILPEEEYGEWLETKDSKGNLLMNGNPIYSLVNKNRTKALRINQDEPRSKKPYMRSWISIFDKGDSGENLPYLAISLELSNITQMESLILIQKWFGNSDDSGFAKLINASNKKFEKNYIKSDIEKAIEIHSSLEGIKRLSATIAKNPSTTDFKNSRLTHSLGDICTIHGTWDKNYETSISNLNKNLANQIYIMFSALTGLITSSGAVKQSHRVPSSSGLSSIWTPRKHFEPQIFVQLMKSISDNIDTINEDLYEEIEKELDKKPL